MECSNLAKKARISGFRLWIIPELSILPLKIAGSGYEIENRRDENEEALRTRMDTSQNVINPLSLVNIHLDEYPNFASTLYIVREGDWRELRREQTACKD